MTALILPAFFFMVMILASWLVWRHYRKMYARWKCRRDCISRIEAGVWQHTKARQLAWMKAWDEAEQQAVASREVYADVSRPRSHRIRPDGSA
jgi:hypothetical protein